MLDTIRLFLYVMTLYSKRRAEANGPGGAYRYDHSPPAFRNQVIHIWRSALGPWKSPPSEWHVGSFNPGSSKLWEFIHQHLCRELGLLSLIEGVETSRYTNFQDQCETFLSQADTNGVLDIVEVSFRLVNGWIREKRDWERGDLGVTQDPDDAIEELNRRFQEHGMGYRFEGNGIVRIDSDLVHAEAVEPAMRLLRDAAFDGANQEFMTAHAHLRAGRHKEAINEALKALESTLKTICQRRDWPVDPNATAKTLLDTVFANKLIPDYLQSHFIGLRTSLESGVPTIRNKRGGHGQGPVALDVPDYLASFAVQLAAVSIVYLVEAHRAQPDDAA